MWKSSRKSTDKISTKLLWKGWALCLYYLHYSNLNSIRENWPIRKQSSLRGDIAKCTLQLFATRSKATLKCHSVLLETKHVTCCFQNSRKHQSKPGYSNIVVIRPLDYPGSTVIPKMEWATSPKFTVQKILGNHPDFSAARSVLPHQKILARPLVVITICLE